MSKLTPGKLAGLKAVSDARGVIAAAAMDQRGSLQKSLAKERGAAADAHDLEEFKTLVTEVLTKHASAILLDPEFGLPASKHRNGKGLLLAYEKTGYDANTPGRLPDLLDVWSVRRLKEAGADCIKILLYYTPYEKTDVNDLKHAWIERIGDECVALDIPFFLEFVGYDAHGGDEKIRRLRQEEARDRLRLHGRVRQEPLQRRRPQGRSPHRDGLRRRHPLLQGREGLHPRRGPAALPRRRAP